MARPDKSKQKLENIEPTLQLEARDKDRPRLEDIDAFLRFAENLEDLGPRESLKAVASSLGIPDTTLFDRLDRLGDIYDGSLYSREEFLVNDLGKRLLPRFWLILDRFRELQADTPKSWKYEETHGGTPNDAPKPIRADWPSLQDIELFLHFCKLDRWPWLDGTLRATAVTKIAHDLFQHGILSRLKNEIAARSRLVACLDRLELRYGKLVEDVRQVGGPGLITHRGKELEKNFRKLLDDLDNIKIDAPAPAAQVFIQKRVYSFPSTSILRHQLLSAPVAAFMLHCAAKAAREAAVEDSSSGDPLDSQFQSPVISVEIKECNTPELVRESRVHDFGIGWELPKGVYQDIEQTRLLEPGIDPDYVEFFAAIPHEIMWAARTRIGERSPIAMQNRQRLKELFEKNEDVSFNEVACVLPGLTVAMLTTEFPLRPDQSELTGIESPGNFRQYVDMTRVIECKNYEDVLQTIRIGACDCAWLPSFYKNRKKVRLKRLSDVGRLIMVFRPIYDPRKVVTHHDHQWHREEPSLLKAIRQFVNDASFKKRLLSGESIESEKIKDWGENMLAKK